MADTRAQHQQNRCLLFENCKSLNDQIRFTSYKNQTQPNHENIKHHTKVAVLKHSCSTSIADLKLFEEEFSKHIFKLKKHYDLLKASVTSGYSISSKLSIKLGYEYFYSRLFKWNIDDLAIDQLTPLLSGEIVNTNERYYKPQFEGNSKNARYNLLKCSFTDHCSVKGDMSRFFKGLKDMDFEADDTPVVNYRVIYKNTRKLVDDIYLNSEDAIRNDDFIKDIFRNNDSFELKFDQNFDLMSLVLSRGDQTETMQSTIDLLRTNNRFDTRFQIKQSTTVDLNGNEEICLKLRELFEDFIRAHDDDEKLVLNCNASQIMFLRREVIKKFNQKSRHDLIDFELNMINYDEYRVLTTLPDAKVIYEANINVNNYVTMTSNLSELFDSENFADTEKSNYFENLTDRIWMLGLWLSNCASNCS